MKRSLTPFLALALAVTPAVRAQFNSGSTGSDGALNLTTAGTVIFDPQVMGLDAAGDNIFNFTTINIASGVTVVMTADVLRNRSVVWLATGNVNIAGTILLKGADGGIMTSSNPGIARLPAMPGPGGFPGGVGGYLTSPATNGGGYGGGAAGTGSASGGNGTYNYDSLQLVPLVGGSGGGGGAIGSGTAGGNGGAGGGAIRIVSSTSITITGTINASGGGNSGGLSAPAGGSGSGGVIHLIAPTVSGSGSLRVWDSNNSGVVKISANTNTYSGVSSNVFTSGPLYNPPLPTAIPQVKVVSVNGVNAPTDVTGSQLVPDFTISASTPVSVNISAQYVPVGTIVTLHLTSEQGNDSTVTCAALAGGLTGSTATCAGATFPQGVTITDIRAVW